MTDGAVSVIVPAHGDVPFLDRALSPLLAQMRSGDELLVVDNNVTVDLAVHATDPRVRVVDARGRGSAGLARNIGVRAARHDLLLFCDADDEAGDGYVEAMRAGLAAHPVVGAPESFHRLNDGAASEAPDSPAVWHWREDPRWPFIGSCALGMTREAFDAVGGFDVAIPALEDVDLGIRLTLAGIPQAGVDGPAVMHIRHRGDPAVEARRQFTHGRAGRWLEARYGHLGLPGESRVRNGVGWLRRVVGLMTSSGDVRVGHHVMLGWKRGRVRGTVDVLGPGSAPRFELLHRQR